MKAKEQKVQQKLTNRKPNWSETEETYYNYINLLIAKGQLTEGYNIQQSKRKEEVTH